MRTLRLSRPPANALNAEVLLELQGALQEATSDARVRALLITSQGKVFSAGADLKAMARATAGDGDAGRMIGLGQDVFLMLEELPKPSVAALQGSAFGGGLELAMSCDLRVAAQEASFGQPEIGLGLIPGWGGTQRLPRLVGRTKALEMLLCGTPLPAAEALSAGLVSRVVPSSDVLAYAHRLCDQLAAMPPAAIAAIKKAVRAGEGGGLGSGLAAEREAFEALVTSADAREGVGAFLEKRKPSFPSLADG